MRKLPERTRPLTLLTMCDSSNLPAIFYVHFSERIIALTFKQNRRKLFKLLKQAENVLLTPDYEFETENAIASLRECGEVELVEWLKTSMYGYKYYDY